MITKEEADALLIGAEYKFAKTMPKHPHWYTLKDKWLDKQSFEKVVMFIRENGKKRKFFRTTYMYYELGEYEYWTMGAPVPETILINKAKK